MGKYSSITLISSSNTEYMIDTDDIIAIYCKDLKMGPLEEFATTIKNYNL